MRSTLLYLCYNLNKAQMRTKEIISTETLIEEPLVAKEPTITICNPDMEFRSNTSMDVMKIELTEEYTKINFIHYADKIYIDGGWVQIQGNTFIRVLGSSDKLTLLKAINIPIAPNKHFYKSDHECLYFTLLFPSIPKSTTHIDIIEKEGGGHTFFNFYGVSMTRVNKSVIRILN
jgi:hypothetical protein